MEIGGIADVVEVSVRYHDELEIARLTACAFKFPYKLLAAV